MTDSDAHPQENINLAILLTFAAGFATTIGASLSFCISPTFTKMLPISLAFAAGVMIYVSFVEILSEALESFEQQLSVSHAESAEVLSHVYVSLSMFGGIVIGYLLDFVVNLLGHDHDHQNTANDPHTANKEAVANDIKFQSVTDTELSTSKSETETSKTENEKPKRKTNAAPKKVDRDLIKTSLVTAIAVALHNFPEGLATFVSTLANPTLGISIAIAIAIHNIPEGISIAMPIYFATGSKCKPFIYSSLSGLVEPVGGLIAYLIIDYMFGGLVFGVLFGFTAGIMIYISFKKLLPTARHLDVEDKYCTYLLFLGFIVMDVSLILFDL